MDFGNVTTIYNHLCIYHDIGNVSVSLILCFIFSCANIYSLAFSPDSMFLASSSNTETVHIFKLESVKDA